MTIKNAFEHVGELLVELSDDLYVRGRCLQESGWSSFLVYAKSYGCYPYDDFDIDETIEDEVFRCKKELAKSIVVLQDDPAYKRMQAATKRYEVTKDPLDRYPTSFNRSYVMRRRQKDAAVLDWLKCVQERFEEEREKELSRMGPAYYGCKKMMHKHEYPRMCQEILDGLLGRLGYVLKKNFLGERYIVYAKVVVGSLYFCFVVDKYSLEKNTDFGRLVNLSIFFTLFFEPDRKGGGVRMSFDPSLLFPVARYPFQNAYGTFLNPQELEMCLKAHVDMICIIEPDIKDKIIGLFG